MPKKKILRDEPNEGTVEIKPPPEGDPTPPTVELAGGAKVVNSSVSALDCMVGRLWVHVNGSGQNSGVTELDALLPAQRMQLADLIKEKYPWMKIVQGPPKEQTDTP